MRGTYTYTCVCVMLQTGPGGMSLDKTFTTEGPSYCSIVIGCEGFRMWAPGGGGSGDQNRKTNDFVRNRDVYGQCSNKQL